MSLPPSLTSVGLLILRVAFGSMMLVHGIPKLMGFSEMAGQFPDPLGMGSQLSLISAIGAEVGCSLLLLIIDYSDVRRPQKNFLSIRSNCQMLARCCFANLTQGELDHGRHPS
jgi:hypothetical protein